MSAKWIVIVEPVNIKDDEMYFIGKANCRGSPERFYGRNLNGMQGMYTKPGLALKFKGLAVKKHQAAYPEEKFLAIAIPADAATRWKARTRRRW